MDLNASESAGYPQAHFRGEKVDLRPDDQRPAPQGKPVVFPTKAAPAVKPSPPFARNEMKQEIVPMDLHHPILREFPEHRDAIRRLKGADDHFRNLFDEYHRLDDEIYRIEEEIDFATDQEIEELKMRRAKLKDYIYHLIRHAPLVCTTSEGASVAR
jgi:uncharacterized protein